MNNKIYLVGVLCALFTFHTHLSSASKSALLYYSYASEDAKEEAIAETIVTFRDLRENQTQLNRQKQVKNCMIDDEFILDKEYSLISWRRRCHEDDTDFTTTRKGSTLVVKGKLNGELIDKELELGNQALHIYPKYSLTKFVMSNMQKMKFWTLRRDKMTKLPMQAIKKGVGIIHVNGKEVEAIKVYYSITGKLREKHFNHNYYYRKSDGVFLKKEEPKGRVEELVKEGGRIKLRKK